MASASPRRRELLSKLFDGFEVLPQSVEERTAYKRPDLIVQDLARIKLGDLPTKRPDALSISADTIVYKDKKVYGKPKDAAQAKVFLDELSGEKHYVYTGVAIYFQGKITTFYDRSTVAFKRLSEEQKFAYIAGGSPMDKAGGYGIQDKSVVERYEGSYTNIVGLPMEKLKEQLDSIITERV